MLKPIMRPIVCSGELAADEESKEPMPGRGAAPAVLARGMRNWGWAEWRGYCRRKRQRMRRKRRRRGRKRGRKMGRARSCQSMGGRCCGSEGRRGPSDTCTYVLQSLAVAPAWAGRAQCRVGAWCAVPAPSLAAPSLLAGHGSRLARSEGPGGEYREAEWQSLLRFALGCPPACRSRAIWPHAAVGNVKATSRP